MFRRTDDDGLRFALHSDSCAGACRHLHPVQQASLQSAHHHRADRRVHRLIDVETGLVPQTPDLDGKNDRYCKFTYTRVTSCFSFFTVGYSSTNTSTHHTLNEVYFVSIDKNYVVFYYSQLGNSFKGFLYFSFCNAFKSNMLQ